MSGVEEEPILSPKNRLKFLCSYGGKILPRPSDGQLKYVGGETRVVSVPRSITFSELKEKITEMFNDAEVVMKYQVMPEDLDALVSVRSDEDLLYMLDEYDRHDHPRSPSSPRFRLFLFSSSPAAAPAPHPSDIASAPLDQRYVEAVNGVPTPSTSRPPIFTVSSSSACTSPTASTIDSALLRSSSSFSRAGMHRVRSTPNLSGSTLSQMANASSVASPRAYPQPVHHQQQHQHPKSTLSGVQYVSGGSWRPGGTQRYEMCRCGCGCLIGVHQAQHPPRKYYFTRSSSSSGGPPMGNGGECSWRGQGTGSGRDESPASRSGQGFYFSAPPPRDVPASRKTIWD